MKVSSATILICTYNRAPLLHETLTTMQEMTPPAHCDVDILVVDNNSSDDTARVVQQAAEHSRFPIALLHERRQGKSFALNTGLAAAGGDVVALTDDDVLPAKDWLARIIETFRTEEVTFVFGKVLPRWSCTPPAELLTVPAQDIWGPLAIVDYGDEPARYEAKNTGQRLPIGANLAFLRSALVAIGGWRTDLGKVNNTLISGEDHEIFMRLRRHGLYSGYYDPKNWVRHYVPAGRLTRQYFRRWFYWSGKTHALMLEDLYPDLNMAEVPKIAGIPRFACRQGVAQAVRYVTSRHGDALRAMIEELRLVQYLGLFVECFRQRKRRRGTPRIVKAATAALLAVWLQFSEGKVSLVATGATVSQILAEWARVGGTRVDNVNEAQGGPIDLRLTDVPESEALDVLLRQQNVIVVDHAAGAAIAPTASRVARILIARATPAGSAVPVQAPPAPAVAPPPVPDAPPPPPSNNPLVQRIIGRDGNPVPDDQQ
jgi:glycosyltransferase involved in cell wall biosynthesis